MHRIAFAACLTIVASLFVLVIGYGFEINAGGSALSPWLPPAGLVLLLSLGTLIWTIGKQAGNPLPLFRPRWPKQIPQPRQRADQAAYAADPQRHATCHHLQPVEGAMRRAGIKVKLLYGTAVEASCTIYESRLELSPPAVYFGNIPGDRQFDPPSATICCEEHNSVIVVIHPDWATPGTPAFPAA